jgi:hypothetical protein
MIQKMPQATTCRRCSGSRDCTQLVFVPEEYGDGAELVAINDISTLGTLIGDNLSRPIRSLGGADDLEAGPDDLIIVD